MLRVLPPMFQPVFATNQVVCRLLKVEAESRDVAKVFNRRKSSNDRRVFGPKAHSSVPLARYT